MQSKSDHEKPEDADSGAIQPNAVYSEPWWRSVGYNSIHPAVTGGNLSNSSSLEYPNGCSESNDAQSLNEEDDDATKEQNTGFPPPGS